MFTTHATLLPLADTRGQDHVTTLCMQVIPRDPTFIDGLLPTCKKCVGLLLDKYAAEDAAKALICPLCSPEEAHYVLPDRTRPACGACIRANECADSDTGG